MGGGGLGAKAQPEDEAVEAQSAPAILPCPCLAWPGGLRKCLLVKGETKSSRVPCGAQRHGDREDLGVWRSGSSILGDCKHLEGRDASGGFGRLFSAQPGAVHGAGL